MRGCRGFIHDVNSLLRHCVSVKSICLDSVVLYTWVVPKLWNQTIEAHRAAVRDAILETTWALVAEHGLRSVTMSQIAKKTGIGRATLYKYFPDVEAILLAWHQRHVAGHLKHLAEKPCSAPTRLFSTSSATLLNSPHSCIEMST